MGRKTAPLAAQDAEAAKELPSSVEPLPVAAIVVEESEEKETAAPAIVVEKKSDEKAPPVEKRTLKVEVVRATRPSLLVRLFSCCSNAPPEDELPYLKVSVRDLLPNETIAKWEDRKERIDKYTSNGNVDKVTKLDKHLTKQYAKEVPEDMEPLEAKAWDAFEAATHKYATNSRDVAGFVRNLMDSGFLKAE